MPVWFGYHMPTFTFPGVDPRGLFDHLATLAGGSPSTNPIYSTPESIAATGALLGFIA
jgi:hypothetical protein